MGVEMTSCSACTAGKYQNPGTAGAVQCLDCPKYTYSWKTGWVGNCFQCYSAASAGADTCTGCDPGKYNYDTNNATACKDCPEGYFTDDRDVRQCSACPIGYHAKNVHTTLNEPRHDACQACSVGKYGHVTHAINAVSGCKDCVQGRYSDDEAVQRLAGEAPTAMCKACPAGKFNPNAGAATESSCSNCKVGTFSAALAATSSGECVACGVGLYSDTVGSTSKCQVCPEGYSQPRLGQAYCLPCRPGTRQNNTGQAYCDPCHFGRASNVVGNLNSKCTACDAGESQPRRGQSACRACAPGSYQNNRGATECIPCPIQWFANQSSLTSCTVCAVGQYSVLVGAVVCEKCGKGMYATTTVKGGGGGGSSTVGGGRCTSCPFGWKREPLVDPSTLTCVRCEMGETTTAVTLNQNQKGATSCMLCPIGQYGSEPGTCTTCEIGRHQEKAGQSTNSDGVVGCDICRHGKVDLLTSECGSCAVGRHGIPLESSGGCMDCEEGQYQSNKKQPTCLFCDAGKIPNALQTECEKPEWKVAEDCTKYEYLDDRCYDSQSLYDGLNVYNASRMGDAVCTTEEKIEHYHCTPCSGGADCRSNNATLSSLRNLPGWWRIPHEFEPIEEADVPVLFARCPFKDDCPGNEVYDNDTLHTLNQCVNETHLVLCSRCKIGNDRIGGTCTPCTAGSIGFRGIALVVVVGVLLGVFFVLKQRIDVILEKYELEISDASLALKLVVAFIQISLSLPGMISNFEFPMIYQSFLGHLKFVNFDLMDLMGVQCVVDVDFRMSVLVSMCFPLVVFVVMLSAYKIMVLRIKYAEEVFMPKEKRDVMGQLFDLCDIDVDGVICETDLIGMFEFVNDKKFSENTLPISLLRNMMKRAGSKVPKLKAIKYTITRAQFIHAALKKRRKDEMIISLYVPVYAAQRHVGLQEALQTCASTTIQLFLLLHAPVSAKAFLYFDCHTLGRKASFLRSDYALQCGSSEYNDYFPVALLLLCGFTLALPAGLGFLMFKNRKELHSTHVRAQIGFLYNRFSSGSEFWEIHELLRKMVFTGLLVYLPANIRPSGALLVCVVACCTLNFFKPYQNNLIFIIGQGTFVLTSIKYLVVVFALSMGQRLGATDMDYIGYVLIGLDVMVMVGTVVIVVAVFWMVKQSASIFVSDLRDGKIQWTENDDEEHSDEDGTSSFTFSMHALKHAVTIEQVKRIKRNSKKSKDNHFFKLAERRLIANVLLEKKVKARQKFINSKRVKAGLSPLYGITKVFQKWHTHTQHGSPETKCEVDTLFIDLNEDEDDDEIEMIDNLFHGLAAHEYQLQLEEMNRDMDDVDSLFLGLHESEDAEIHEIDSLFSGLPELSSTGTK